MLAIKFGRNLQSCHCCGETTFCVEGVHVKNIFEEDGGDKDVWVVVGPCDGSCKTELQPEVAQLVAAFKETGHAESWNQRRAKQQQKQKGKA